MDEEAIQNLREALKISPDNIPLRKHLANSLERARRFAEAEAEYVALLRLTRDDSITLGLANALFHQGKYSQSNVILEERIGNGGASFDALILHARALLRENSVSEAIDIYKKALELNPTFTDGELDGSLRMAAIPNEEDTELEHDNFLQRPDINFEHVGGMANVKKEIDLKIIKPLQHADLYKAYGKKTGGGILLYGPPGCGKTFIARATAGQVNARFISVELNDILDMWIGNSEKNLHAIFELARAHTPCVLFFDEIDALGASRSDMKQSGGRHLINQFLQELDGVENKNDGILILGATNTPWHMDPAFRRPGRFDRIIFIPPPDETAREAILELKLRNKPVGTIDYRQVARRLEHMSGADIEAIIDIAVELKLEQSFSSGTPQPITTQDLITAAKKHKASTAEWFATARNFALFANDSGLYDEILNHLKIKK